MLTTSPTHLNHRQRAILDYARSHGEVQVDPLSQHFEVTPQTIRRDLNRLCDLHLLQRTHGGAVASSSVANMGYAARQQLAAQGKQTIGKRAADLIPNDSSLFVNIGTTTEQVARHLKGHFGLVVITNNINVVNILRPLENIDVITAGGTVRREDGGIVGDATVEFIEQFKVDFAVVGASAIEEDGTLLDFDPREVRVSKAIIENSRSVVLVADSVKFSRSAPVRIGNISQVDYFVTDKPPPAGFLERCAQHGVRVEITELDADAPTHSEARNHGD